MSDHTQIQIENFKPVPGYEGYYEVSDHGTVRSVQRVVMRSNGAPQTVRARVLKAYPGKTDYLSTSLSKNGRVKSWNIHTLVMRAFVGPLPDGMEVRHLDGNAQNNHLSNLRYGTHAENVQDMLRHGTGYAQSKTHCSHGHAYSGENLRWVKGKKGYMFRVCVTCKRARSRKGVREGTEDFKTVADEIYSTLNGEEIPNVA